MTGARWSTWSNLAYPVAGVLTGSWPLALLFGVLGVCSWRFHWWEGEVTDWHQFNREVIRRLGWHENQSVIEFAQEKARVWSRADAAAMFALLIGIVLAALENHPVIILLCAPIVGIGFRYGLVRDGVVTTTGVTVAFAAFAVLMVATRSWPLAGAGAGLLLLAVGVRQLGEEHGWWWSHGLWHVLAAAGTAVLAGGAG